MTDITVIIAGHAASGKTVLINKVLLPALKNIGGYGYEVHDETIRSTDTYAPIGESRRVVIHTRCNVPELPDESTVDPGARPRATELEWLRWFARNADFGPADGDVRQSLKEQFMEETAKNLPKGWNMGSDGETTMDME